MRIPTEDFTDATLASEDPYDHDDHDELEIDNDDDHEDIDDQSPPVSYCHCNCHSHRQNRKENVVIYDVGKPFENVLGPFCRKKNAHITATIALNNVLCICSTNKTNAPTALGGANAIFENEGRNRKCAF